LKCEESFLKSKSKLKTFVGRGGGTINVCEIPIQLPVMCGQFNPDWTKREPILQCWILRSHWLCDNQ